MRADSCAPPRFTQTIALKPKVLPPNQQILAPKLPHLRWHPGPQKLALSIRKKQAVKHYPKTYENVSAYVSFHTFF
jgi:hypothetical protein